MTNFDSRPNSTHAAGPADFVVAASLTRGPITESWHRAIAAVTDSSGKLIDQLGVPQRLIYPRSALKPLQVLAMRAVGLQLQGEQLAITAGSHTGTPAHQSLVTQILADAGTGSQALQCPAAWPGNPTARAAASEPSRLAFNCSGKHAGFIAAARKADWGIDDYLGVGHPMQQLALATIAELCGEAPAAVTTDGCGAPLPAITLLALARGIGAFARLPEAEPVKSAMVQHAWAVGDYDTPDVLIMQNTGMVAKLGAEGVFVLATESGESVAVKVADGSLRVAGAIALNLLLRNGLLGADQFATLLPQLAPKVLGGEAEVGQLVLH